MPLGLCKLCMAEKNLQDSHLIPRAMYKYLRDVRNKNPNPVVVGADVTATTSKQVSDYVLCADCEDLFNKQGESYTLTQVWNGKRFPLLDRLNVAHQDYTFQRALVFSGHSVGVNTDKLAYFALSVIWRAAVHVWDLPFEGKTTLLDLGRFAEPIRRFLHCDSPFPDDVVVWATVCTDTGSIGAFFTPSRVVGIPEAAFGVLTLGVHFQVYTGSNIHPILREFCCVRATRKPLFLRNCEDKTLYAYARLMATSKPSKKLV